MYDLPASIEVSSGQFGDAQPLLVLYRERTISISSLDDRLTSTPAVRFAEIAADGVAIANAR